MSMITLLRALLDADLSKSNLTMSLTLLMQTAGYGKVEDDLSDSRLEQLSGLRRDRARAAVREIVGMGLFEMAGKGKYGTLYRIPAQFLGEGGYIGFSLPAIGQSETDAYTEYAEVPEHNTATDLTATYQNLVNEHQQLLDSHQVLVSAHQNLVETNRILVNTLPSLGEQLTETRLNANQNWVTDINKPQQIKTTTPLNPDIGAMPEHWPDALQYPTGLSVAELAEAPKKLDGLHPAVAQDVLDALAWKMANGKVKKSNIGLLFWLSNEARNGTFDHTPALEWRKRQQAVQLAQTKMAAGELRELDRQIQTLQSFQKLEPEGSGQWVLYGRQIETKKTDYYQKLEVLKAGKAMF